MHPSGGMPSAPPGGPYPPPMAPGWAMPAPPQPRPRGTPNRSLFLTGAVGHFIAAGMAIPFSLFALYFAFAFGSGFGFFSIFPLTAAILMGVALVFQHVGFYGFWRNYGSAMGITAFLFGLTATAIFLGSLSLAFTSRDFLSAIVGIASIVLLGVMFILDGVAFLVNRHFALPDIDRDGRPLHNRGGLRVLGALCARRGHRGNACVHHRRN